MALKECKGDKMKIAFIIPFYYKWDNFSNVRANSEYLRLEGHDVGVFSRKEIGCDPIDWNWYDIIMLHGSGAVLPEEEFKKCKKPIISFGWSDPNLYNETHFNQGNIYCTNSLIVSKYKVDKSVYFYNTACDKRHHKDLNLQKGTDILVYGAGTHKFVTNRNEVVNKLRNLGFKVKVFGRGWNKHPDTYEFIEGEGLAQEICKAHLLLDVTNRTTAWGHRVFEASARGTPVLTIDREDTRQMFDEGTEILLYKDFGNMVGLLHAYLGIPKVLRMIGKRAQKRCYKDHDISVRIKELLKIMEKL